MSKQISWVLIFIFAFSIVQIKSNAESRYMPTPIGYWNFDEGSSIGLLDLSPNRNAGKINVNTYSQYYGDTASFTNIKRLSENAGYFTGASCAQISDIPEYELGKDFTVAAWCKISSNSNGSIVCQWYYFQDSFGLDFRDDRFQFTVSLPEENTYGKNFTVLSKNMYEQSPYDESKWVHCAGVFDGLKLKLYIDGGLDNEIILPSEWSGKPVRSSSTSIVIGNMDPVYSWTPINGGIDEVYMFNEALTAEQINNLLNYKYGNYPSPSPMYTKRPTNTPRPTYTKRPTNTPRPTYTKRPTNTPKPTNTKRPTSTPKSTNTPRSTYMCTATDTATPTITPDEYYTPDPTLLPTEGQVIEDQLVEPWVVENSGKDRALEYAETINPVNEERYEFMLTPEKNVIYKKGNDAWKYFGDMGFDLNSTASVQKSIGKFEMIAADGNRIVAKTFENELFFASLVDGSIALDKGDGSEFKDTSKAKKSFFITEAPDDYNINQDYDSYARNIISANKDLWYLAYVLPISKDLAERIKVQMKDDIKVDIKKGINDNLKTINALLKSLGLPEISINNFDDASIDIAIDIVFEYIQFNLDVTKPAIPYAWPVVVDAQKWYRIKGDNLSSMDIIDIGVFDINKVSAAKAKYENTQSNNLNMYLKKFGSEYHRPYNPRIPFGDFAENEYLQGEDRDYCSFVDGTCNYYALAYDYRHGEYHVMNIDEQAQFCSKWYKFSQILEQKMSEIPLSFIEYNPDNWTRSSYDYRSTYTIVRLLHGFIEANRNNTPYLNSWNSAAYSYKFSNYNKPGWREVGPHDEDPWLWSAYESVESPNVSHLQTYFNKIGLWSQDVNNENVYRLDTPFKQMWDNQKLKFFSNPTMDVSMENIVVSDYAKVYSINWGWGSLDFTWRVRNKPFGAWGWGNNIMIRQDMKLYVPGYKSNVDGTIAKGYYYQDLLPKSYLDSSENPTYDYPDKILDGNGLDSIPHFPHENEWEFMPEPEAEIVFTNSHYDFDPINPYNE